MLTVMIILLPTRNQRKGKRKHVLGHISHDRMNMKWLKNGHETAAAAPLLHGLNDYNNFSMSVQKPHFTPSIFLLKLHSVNKDVCQIMSSDMYSYSITGE